MQFPEICLTLGGITTGIQIRLHVIIFKIGIGLPFGTSNTDTWRLKPPTRRQLLVDRSELCTKYIFNFFSTYPRSVRAKKKRKKRKKKKKKVFCRICRFWKMLKNAILDAKKYENFVKISSTICQIFVEFQQNVHKFLHPR